MRPRSRRRVAITVLVAALVVAVVGLAVTGTGEPASALRLLTGDAWLENASAGTVSHVNGYTGRADIQTTVGRPGDPFEVVQRADGAYVLDLRTGKLLRLDDSTLSVVSTATETGTSAALQVVAGTSTTWVIDHSSGIVQQVIPSTLAPIGRQIALGGRTGAAWSTPTGSLWVPRNRPGGPSTRSTRLARSPGSRSAIPATRCRWRTPARACGRSTRSRPRRRPCRTRPSTRCPARPASPTGPLVGVVVLQPRPGGGGRPEVLDIDTSLPALSSLALPAAAQATQVAVPPNRAYLLDPRADQLQTVDLAPLQALPPIPVPAGANQLVSQGPAGVRQQHRVSAGAGGQRQRRGDRHRQVRRRPRQPGPGRAATPRPRAGLRRAGAPRARAGGRGRPASRPHRRRPPSAGPLRRRPPTRRPRPPPTTTAPDAAVCPPTTDYLAAGPPSRRPCPGRPPSPRSPPATGSSP